MQTILDKCNCDCYFSSINQINYKGNLQGSIVIIGEAINEEDIIANELFSGTIGKIIHDCLTYANIDIDDCLFLNAIGCMVPKHYKQAERSKQLSNAIKQCQKRLADIISKHPRELVITLGNAASHAILNDFNLKITQVRGTVYACSFASKGVYATVHPSYILRGGGRLNDLKNDFEYAASLLTGVKIKQHIKPTLDNIKVIEENEVNEFFHAMEKVCCNKDHVTIACDIETTGLNRFKNRILCMGLSWDPEIVYVLPKRFFDKIYEANGNCLELNLLDSMLNSGAKFLWHNGKFDITFLRVLGLKSARVDHDTMLMSYTLNELGGYHSLGYLSKDLLGAPDYKDMLSLYLPNKKASYELVPEKVLHEYMAYDVSNTLQIYNILSVKISDDKLNTTLYNKVLIPASELLAKIELEGFSVNMETVKENDNKLYTQLQDILAKMPEGLNPNSPKQVAVYLYDILKLQTIRGSRSTDAKHITELNKKYDNLFLKQLLEYRKLDKLHSTFVKSIYEKVCSDGKIHTTYKIHGTVTGRLSSEEPNMQNIPRKPFIRNQFITDKNHIMIECDYSQAELRSLAQLSNDAEMIKVFEEGISLHVDVSKAIFGEEWEKNYNMDDPNNPAYVDAKEKYIRTKMLNFGIIYGISAWSIAKSFEMDKEEAIKMIDGWATKFPQAWAYIQKCREAPLKGQNLITPFGRRKRANFVSKENLNNVQNESANFPHQSMASDFTLVSACRLASHIKRTWDAKIVNIVHDALFVNIPYIGGNVVSEKNLNDCIKYIKHVMEETPRLWGLNRVTFSVDAKTGYSWGNLHDYKS